MRDMINTNFDQLLKLYYTDNKYELTNQKPFTWVSMFILHKPFENMTVGFLKTTLTFDSFKSLRVLCESINIKLEKPA